MKSKLALFCSLAVCVTIACFHILCCAESNPISTPAHFPELMFDNSLSQKEQAYLGIQDKSLFSINDIKSTFILIDLTNTYCVSCKKNIIILNEVYKLIQDSKDLRSKVKVMGIAIGNNKREVDYLRKEHKIVYPLVTDPDFAAHKALGEPRVPYTMYIRRDSKGNEIILKIHKGVFKSADNLIKEIQAMCADRF